MFAIILFEIVVREDGILLQSFGSKQFGLEFDYDIFWKA
jgi:hypothetical protein